MLGGRHGAGHPRLDVRPDATPAIVADPRDDVARATEHSWWTLRWNGWAPWSLDPMLLVLAAYAVVVDVVSAWTDVSLGTLGRVPVSPALPLAVLVAVHLGLRALGWSKAGWRAWREYGIAVGAIFAVGVTTYSLDVGGLAEALGLVVAAFSEELVYRVALLVLVGAAVARVLGRDWRCPTRWGTAPGVVALGVGALAFTALPGHVAQIEGPMTMLAFASLALVLGWVVLRTGVVWPAVVAHCVLNLATITALVVDVPAGLAAALAAATLLALIAAGDVAGRRSGRLRPVPNVIDLTAL